MMLAKDLKQKSVEELNTLAAQLAANIRDAGFRLATRQLTKVSEVAAYKRDLARVKTVLRGLKSA